MFKTTVASVIDEGNKALDVFYKTIEKLTTAQEQLNEKIAASEKKVSELTSEIQLAQAEQVIAQRAIESFDQTINKIKQITG